MCMTIKERLGCAIESLEKGAWNSDNHPAALSTDGSMSCYL